MAKMLSAAARTPFTPPDQLHKPKAKRIVYHLRTPRVRDRAALIRAAEDASSGREIDENEVLAVLRAGIREIYRERPEDEAERERLLKVVNQYQVLSLLPSGDLQGPTREAYLALADDVVAIQGVVRRDYEPLRRLLREREAYLTARVTETARLLTAGADNLDVGEIGPDGLSDAQLDLFPPGHADAVGMKALSLFAPAGHEAKNSESPSPGPSGRATSTAASDTPDTTRAPRAPGDSKGSGSQSCASTH